VWGVARLRRGLKLPRTRLTAREAEAHWEALAGSDAALAWQAARALSGDAERGVPLLRQGLRPIAAPDPERLRRLISDLDADRPAVRQKAADELRRQGEAVFPALRDALKNKPSLEVRRR